MAGDRLDAETFPTNAPDAERASFTISNSAEQVEKVQSALVAAAQKRTYPKASVFAVRLAVQEAIANAFNHGHEGLPPDTTISVRYAVADDRIEVCIIDQGPGFDPDAIPDPTVEENLEVASGRGVLLMKAYMTEVRWVGRGNRVEMTYRKPG